MEQQIAKDLNFTISVSREAVEGFVRAVAEHLARNGCPPIRSQEVVSAEELAGRLGFEPDRIRRLVLDGVLPVIRYGNEMVFDMVAVREALTGGLDDWFSSAADDPLQDDDDDLDDEDDELNSPD